MYTFRQFDWLGSGEPWVAVETAYADADVRQFNCYSGAIHYVTASGSRRYWTFADTVEWASWRAGTFPCPFFADWAQETYPDIPEEFLFALLNSA